jgi:hypothetical protein
MPGTPSRTARVPIARWDLKEAEGKSPARGTRTAYEANVCGRGGVGPQNPKASGTDGRRCGGRGEKVTRLTLGDLSCCREANRTERRGVCRTGVSRRHSRAMQRLKAPTSIFGQVPISRRSKETQA